MDLGTILERIGIGLGLITIVAGLFLLVATGLADAAPFDIWLAQLVVVIGVIMGVWVARTRYRSRQYETWIPDVEFPMTTAAPGDEIDDLIYRLTELREGTTEYREQIRTRVAEIAVSVIQYRFDTSRAEAIQQLEDGSWTENDVAASYFTGDAARLESLSFFDALRERLTETERPFIRQLKTVVDAIEETSDFEFNEDTHGDFEPPERGMRQEDIISPTAGERVNENTRYLGRMQTHQWTGVTAFAFIALAIGVLSAIPALILVSAVAVGVAGLAHLTFDPRVSDLEVTRVVGNDSPEPGEEVEVTVTVENTGETFLSDLRFVDRVPPMMAVTDGTARFATALRPGGTASFSYTVIAERGEHTWPLQVLGRNFLGSVELNAVIEPDTAVYCAPRLRTATEMPVRLQTSIYSGGVDTKIGGEGLEFFSVRDYQPGDPKRRIDWKTYAKTGEFTTVEFRKEQAARLVLLFDGREASYVSSSPGRKHALDRGVDIAFDVYASLHDQGHLIGMAAYNGIPMWLGTGTGALHEERVRRLFVDHPAISPLPPAVSEEEVGRYIDPLIHIRRQLPMNTQIFLFSPLTDEYTYEVARQLDGAGHLVTVISPDPTAIEKVGQRIARLERQVLINRLRDHGIRVLDMDEEESINIEIERAKRRWAA